LIRSVLNTVDKKWGRVLGVAWRPPLLSFYEQ